MLQLNGEKIDSTGTWHKQHALQEMEILKINIMFKTVEKWEDRHHNCHFNCAVSPYQDNEHWRKQQALQEMDIPVMLNTTQVLQNYKRNISETVRHNNKHQRSLNQSGPS